MTEKVKKSEEPHEGKSTEGGDFVPEIKTIKSADSYKEYFKRGGISEFSMHLRRVVPR